LIILSQVAALTQRGPGLSVLRRYWSQTGRLLAGNEWFDLISKKIPAFGRELVNDGDAVVNRQGTAMRLDTFEEARFTICDCSDVILSAELMLTCNVLAW